MFFPISEKQKRIIQNAMKELNLPPLIIPKKQAYTDFIKIKKTALASDLTRPPVQITSRSRELQKKLSIVLKKHTPILKKYLKQLGLYFKPQRFTIYILPKVGENAESLHNFLVLGDGFKVSIAIGIIIEELLHSLIKGKGLIFTNLTKKMPEELREEAIVGYYLHKILSKLKIMSKKDQYSLVFGWGGGMRKNLVKKLLKERR